MRARVSGRRKDGGCSEVSARAAHATAASAGCAGELSPPVSASGGPAAVQRASRRGACVEREASLDMPSTSTTVSSLTTFIKSHGSSQFAVCFAGAVVLGGVIATALAHVVPCPWPLKSRSKNVHVLAVFLTIKPGTLALFKERFAAVARSARSAAEPGCLSYELSVNVRPTLLAARTRARARRSAHSSARTAPRALERARGAARTRARAHSHSTAPRPLVRSLSLRSPRTTATSSFTSATCAPRI